MAELEFLTTSGLTRHFGGIHAVDGIDFALDEGEIRALIGPNGAGKSTFVGLLSGRITASAGTIRYKGRDVTRMPAYRRVNSGIAYTFQITNIYNNLTVWENVAVAVQSRLRHESHGSMPDLVRDALDAVGLADRAEGRAGDLAYGHQRLLEIAMGLALKPSLLILDEPTQGLSDPEITEFCGLVKTIAQSATVLLIEHNMDVVMELADRITVLDRGQVLAEGDPAAIRDDPEVQAAYLGTG